MLSFETLARFPAYDSPLRNPCPAKLLGPLQGNFLALVSNLDSPCLGQDVARTFRRASSSPGTAISAPGFLPAVRSSDHWSFWQ